MPRGVAVNSPCKTLAGPSTPHSSTPSRKCKPKYYMGHCSSSFIRTTTPDPSVLGLEDTDKQLLPEFVQMAHQNVRRCPLLIFPDSWCIRMSMPSCLKEGGVALDTFLLP